MFSMWDGYLSKPEYLRVKERFDSAGARFEQIHASGHATPAELERFASAIQPRNLVPIHGDAWDQHLDRFAQVRRLADGEAIEIR